MGRARTIARRTFVIGSAAAAGGLVLGWALVKWPIANPLLDGLDDDEVAFNPYVRIGPEGITIITPRADVGQGAYSAQAALVAEELDLEWGGFAIEPGLPSAAYFNGAAFHETLPIAATDQGMLARRVRSIVDGYVKLRGTQITGASSTIPDGYVKLRMAGAAAREMLLAAAAAQLGVAVSALRTERSAVIAPDGTRLPYTTLAAAAAELDPPARVTLRDPSTWRLLGKPMQRLDIVAKSTGRARYGIDLRFPDVVYATVRRNPRIGAGLRAMDDAEAALARGVIKVVPITGGVGVIADNTWRAFQGARLLRLDWEPATYPPSSSEMFARVAESFTPEYRDSRLRNDGDVERAVVEEGVTRVEAEYRLPYLAHAPLEPLSAVARFDAGRLEIWAGTQIPSFARKFAAEIAGISPEHVTLHAQLSGGSFGRRLDDDFIRHAVELAVAHQGPPIKMTWTREEDFAHDFPRPLAIGRGTGAVRAGQVHAFSLDVASPAPNSSQARRLKELLPGPDVSIVAGAWDQPFAIPHYRVTGYKVPDMVPVSSWRSVGASINGFLHECFLDELILAAGADPLAERIRLCAHEPSRRVLEAVGELSNWGTPLGEGRGRGVAFTLSFGVPVAEVVELRNTPEGIRIDAVFLACEVGKVLDPVNFENQVQGGVIWGLGHAMNAELTYADGMPEQSNFHQFSGLRFDQTPRIVIRALETVEQIRGIGEPPVPPAAPALANAIFAATGQRIRELPLRKHIRFA